MSHPLPPQESVTTPPVEAQPAASPFTFEFFLVQCANFRSFGYRDLEGKWRQPFSNVELPGFVRVLE